MKTIPTEAEKEAIAAVLRAKCRELGVRASWALVFFNDEAPEDGACVTDAYDEDAAIALAGALVSLTKAAQDKICSLYTKMETAA